MKRYLGVDYGSKKIGLALSDEAGTMAFPLRVVKMAPGLIEHVALLAKEYHVGGVVIGESRNYAQEENPIMKKVHLFRHEIEKKTGLPVYFEEEFLTSKQAEREQGKSEYADASAAAIILQSYLDKIKQT